MQLTEEILRERKTGIGGSECAAVLGLSKWASPLDIYLSKISDDINIEQTEPQKWGHALEPLVIKEYENVTNQEVEQPNTIIKNEKYPWLLANIDGKVKDKNIILEAKTTRFFNDEWGEPYTDEIPQQYLLQCAHYCIVLGDNISKVDIAVLAGGQEFRIYQYERNKQLEEMIIQGTHDFWENHIKKRMPPDPDSKSDIIKTALRRID